MEDNRAKKLLDSFVDRLKANKRLEIAVYCGLGALLLLLPAGIRREKAKGGGKGY